MSMYFSIYRIHTDKGSYVGHTKDFNLEWVGITILNLQMNQIV
jgi:hypothetical protein